ncbi:MAG: hypothetical protein QM704_02555 [Anaeromyxobacteraceae bacterium]
MSLFQTAAALLVAAVATTARAQAPATAPEAPLGEIALAPALPGAEGYLVLADGETIQGKILRSRPGVVAVRRPNGDVVFSRAADVAGLLDVTVPHGSLPEGPPLACVVLRDGKVLRGRLLGRTGGAVLLEVGGDVQWTLPDEKVARILRVVERTRPADISDRHLTAPSAVLVPSGGLRLALVEAADLSATVGLGGHAALTAGTTLPVLHAASYGRNVFGALRGGAALGEHLRLASGLHVRAGSGGSVQGFLSGTVSLTYPALLVTLHAGPIFEGAEGLGAMGATGVALAVTSQVAPRVDLLGEVWASRRGSDTPVLAIVGARWRVGRMALDAGAASALDGPPRIWFGLQLDATP